MSTRQNILFFLLSLIIIVSLSCDENNQSDSWKDTYGILPGNGIITGDFIVEDIWYNDNIYIYISQKDSLGADKLCGVDTVRNNNFVFFNILPGEYHIAATVDINTFKYSLIQNLSRTSFKGYGQCMLYGISVINDTITYINERIPGHFMTAEVFDPFIQFCVLRQNYKPITEIEVKEILYNDE